MRMHHVAHYELAWTSIPWVRVRKIQDDCIRLSLGYSSYQSIYIMSRSYSDLKLRGSGILGRARASALVSKISINPRNRDVAGAVASLFHWTITWSRLPPWFRICMQPDEC